MYATIIKYFITLILSFFISFKIINLSYTTTRKIMVLCTSFVLSITIFHLELYAINIKYYLAILIIGFVIVMFTHRPALSFFIATFSFVGSYTLHGLSSFITSFFCFFIADGTLRLNYTLLAIISSVLHTSSVIFLFKHKRFNSKLQNFTLNSSASLITLIGLFILLLLTHAKNFDLFNFAIIICFFTLIILIYWWQTQITKAYKRSLEQREMESLRTELQEKNATLLMIREESDRVHHINHRDNGLLTTLDYAVSSILDMDFSDEEAVKARCKELRTEIHRARDRRVTTVHADEIPITRYETGISLLTLLLNRTSKRAVDEHVLFTVHISAELGKYIPEIITDDDLVYLLSDLLDNAFVATQGCNVRMIQLQFYKWNNHLVVEIADNGTPFEAESILQMGIERRTTHADTGGTGVGLMDIWAMKEKYRATYHLDEHEVATPFTKKISITFDKKNRYSVRTWRKDAILTQSKRIDLQVYEQTEA